jgi:hypothetical protein
MTARSIIEMRDAHPELFCPQDVARFWALVCKSAGCWEWQASTLPTGYGNVRVGSLRDGTRRIVRAHRMSWMLAHGPIPEGMCVCHHCDNPKCVRPDHLFLGTLGDNTRDMFAKGRGRDSSGERSAMAKLQWADIREIRASDATARELAVRFEVTQQTIRMIRRGLAWTKEVA